MSMQGTPKMPLEGMERLVEQLPEPSYIKVSLTGDFDYSDVGRQVGKTIIGLELDRGSLPTFTLANPSNKAVIDIHRQYLHDIRNDERRACDTKRGLKLDSAVWTFGKGSIEVDPWEIKATYSGSEEPEQISRVRKIAQRENLKMEIKIN